MRTPRPGIASALPADAEGAPYDRHAALYDRLIVSPLYNRAAWGARPAEYAAFAGEALAYGTGPFLDAGCGTAVFTAEAYRRARGVGRSYMAALRRPGEFGPPRTAAQLEAAAREIFRAGADVTRIGSMAYLRAAASG